MVLRIVPGALSVGMAAGQLSSFWQMPRILAAYGLVSGASATALAAALIAGELVCGFWFLARPRSRARVAEWVFTAVAVVWALLAEEFLMTQTPAPRRKADRDEVFVEFTKSICPLCKTPVDAQVNIRENKVFLRKRCREHGEFEALVYGDAEEYLASARFNKPGTIPLTFQTEVRDGCPSDCGLCPEHKQHACLGIIEVNTGCNLDCPICFADSGHQPDGYAITQEQCATMLDTFVASEGDAEVVMFSGGEPTIHKHILHFIDLAQARPIRNVTLNTNGIRLATDRRFVAELGTRNRTRGKSVNIYLQFDGFDARTHLQIRGRDLREVKQRALDHCAAEGLTITLVAAVERGLNEHELGAIIEYGIDHPAVRSVAFQPVTHSGRHVPFDPLNRLTNPDVIRLIQDQLPGWFRKGDFFPVPCCFPTCRSVTYLLVDGRPGDRTVVPIPRLLNVEDYLDYVTNRVLPDAGIREALEKLWSASAFMGTETTEENCGPLPRRWTAPTCAGSICRRRSGA